ncbi:MAG: 2-amino-4-hydroxy-6-hydroxymethyldihydropteridine diphosphokinase [Betaproteobacteria bacterium]
MSLAYVGVGSNLRDPQRQVAQALAELDAIPATRVLDCSSLYRSAPVGHAAQPDFINAVAALETALDPETLLGELQAIEARHGRSRSFPDAPRTLDLDLLLYGEGAHRSARLTIPHPRMHERAFVLKPLVEIASDIAVPGRGRARDLLAACAGQRVERHGG